MKRKEKLLVRPADTRIEAPAARGAFETIVGQQEAIERLKAFASHYRAGNQVLGHILIHGEVGLGKKTLVRAFAEELNIRLQEVKAGDVLRPLDLTTVLSILEPNQALLIPDIHELKRASIEILREVLIDFKLDAIVGKGPGARAQVFQVEPFTCIATTTSPAKCSAHMLDVFVLKLKLGPYSEDELKRICGQVARKHGLSLSPTLVSKIARLSDGKPKQIEGLIRQLQHADKDHINEEDAAQFLSALGVRSAKSSLAEPSGNFEQLTGMDFERLITTLLQKMGFRAEMTRPSGDGGIDIAAYLDQPITGGRYLIQCKRFSPKNSVGAPVVREFYGVFTADKKAVKGIFITTSSFTDQARQFAQDLPLELIDGALLHKLLDDYGLN